MRLLSNLNPTTNVTVQPSEQELPPDSAWGKGLRRGLAGAGNTVKSFGAQLAEPLAPEWSRQQIAEANANMQDVVRQTPMVDRIENIHNAGDFGEWLAGTTAQAVPSIMTAAGGAVAGRLGLRALAPGMNPMTASMIGGTAGVLPQEAGETAMALHGDPTAMENTSPWGRTGLMMGKGLATSAMEAAVPAMTVNKFMRATPLASAGLRPAMAHVGKTSLQGGAGEAFTEGAQHVTGQFTHALANPDVEVINGLDIANAMAAGMAPGTVMGAAGGAADAVHGNLNAAGRQMRKPYDWVRELTPEKAIEDAGRLGASARGAVDSSVDYVTRGAEWVKDKTGVAVPKWPGQMTDEQVMEAAHKAGMITRVGGQTAKQSYEAFKEGFLRQAAEDEAGGDSTPLSMRVAEIEDYLMRKTQDAKNLGQAGVTAFGAGYSGRDLVTPKKDVATRIFEETGKTTEALSDEILSSRNIDTSGDPDKFTASVAKQSETVQKVLSILGGDQDVIMNENYGASVMDLIDDPEVNTDPGKQKRVFEIAKQFQSSRPALKDILDKLPKTQSTGSASRQMTDDVRDKVDGLTSTLSQYGITDKQLVSKLSDTLSKSDRAGFDRQLLELKASGIIDVDARKVLEVYGPELVPADQIAEHIKKRKPKNKPGSFGDLGDLYFNKAYINSRVRDYVTEAVQGTPYEGEGDRLSIESAVMGMLEAVSNDTMTNQQVQSMRTSMEKALGDAGNTLFEATMEAAGYYTGQGKFSAMRARPEHTSAVESLRNMRNDSTPAGGKHEHTRSVLNKLVTTFMGAEAKSVNESSQYGTSQLDSLRERGMFKEAVALQSALESKSADPYAAYNKALGKYFGPKAKSADAVVRSYAKQLGHEIKGNAQVGNSGTGRVAEDDLDDYELRQKAHDRVPDADEKQVVAKDNEVGTQGQEEDDYGSGDRYFGQSAKNLGKFDEYPGAPLTTSKTYDHPDGEFSAMKDEVSAKWGGLRVTPIKPIDWAEEQKGDPEDLLTEAAEAMIEKDKVEEKRLKRLGKEEGIKIHKGQVIDNVSTRALIDKQLDAIKQRRALWEKSKSGTSFFNDDLNNGLLFIKTSRAKGTMLEVDKITSDRFEFEDNRAEMVKWIERMLGRSPASAESFKNSLIKLRAADGKVYQHDIAGNVFQMFKRNQQGDLSGVFEKGLEPTFKDLLRGAFSSTITSLMMSGHYAGDMLVDGGKFPDSLVIYRDDVEGTSITYGEVFGLKPREQGDFSKHELGLIVPKESGADAYAKAQADLDAAKSANKNTEQYEKNITAAMEAVAAQTQKYVAARALVDKNGKKYNFNPRMMLKGLMTRHGMDADKYLPANTATEGLSREITDRLMKEGMEILARQGFEPASSNFGSLTVALWETQYGDETYSMTAGRSFARKATIEQENAARKLAGEKLVPEWGAYTGTFDVRADQIVRENENVDRHIEDLAKLEEKLATVKAVKGTSSNLVRADLQEKIAAKRESLAKANEELLDMMGWSERERGNEANRFSKVDTDNTRMEEAYRNSKRPVVRGEEQIDAQATETPALFDVSQLYQNNQILHDLKSNETVAPKDEPEFVSVFKLFDEIMAEINADMMSATKLYTGLQKTLDKAVADGKIAQAEQIRKQREDLKARIKYLKDDLKNKKAVRGGDMGAGMRVSVSNDKLAQRGQEAAKKGWFDDVIKEAMRLPKPAMQLQPSKLDMAAGKTGKSGSVKPDTMTVQNKLYRPEVNRADARSEAYRARLADVKAQLDARKARRRPAEPDAAPTQRTESVPTKDLFELLDMLDAQSKADSAFDMQAALVELVDTVKMPTHKDYVAAVREHYGDSERPKVSYALSKMLVGKERGSSSKQSPTGQASNQSEASVRADVTRRLGDTVDFFMRSVLPEGKAGQHTPPGPDQLKSILEVSMTMSNWGGVAAHETWHEVGRLLGTMGAEGKQVIETINKAMLNPDTYAMLKEHFKDDANVLAQMEPGEGHNYLEERAAFAFQLFFENGGKMPLVPRVRGIFSKLAEMFKKLIGITDDLIKTENFFKYFDKGEFLKDMDNPHSVLAALNETRREKYLQQLGRATKPLRDLAFAAFGHAADRIKEMNIPAYTEILERMQIGTKENVGYMKEQRTRMQGFFNEFSAIVEGMGGKLTQAAEAKVSELVQRIEKYKADVGRGSKSKVEFDLGRTELPFTADLTKIEGRLDEFRKDLKTYGGLQGQTAADIDEVVNDLMLDGYYSNADLFRDYPEKAKKYATDDINRQAFAYIKKSTHQAEMARAFKDISLDNLLAMGDEKATPYQRSLIRTFTNAATGRSGLDMSPQLRKLFGTVITGINISLLPFAVFSQMVEPLQLAFRKNDLKSAVGSAFRGLKGMPRMFEGVDSKTEKDFFEKVTAELGLVTEAATVSMMADLMNEVPITGALEKVNKAFFRYNGMEFWHRTMYAAAVENAFGFIKDHAEDKAELAELLIEPSDVKLTKDGRVDHTDPKMRAAIIRFATESMAQPDAATNTMWMNDPRLALIGHLKRFTFGFSYYINSRAVNHIKKGEYRQLAPLAFAVPWMIAVDGLRDMLRPGPEGYKADWGVTEHTASGIERSGLLGRYGIAADAIKTMEYGGSAVEAISPAAQITGKIARGVSEGHGWDALFKSLPGHQLVGV